MPKLDKLSASQILTICDDYRCQDYIDSLDRAELMRHFGGGALNPDCDELGLISDNNWLMGYKYLNKAFRQIFGLYTSDAGLVEISVKQAITPERRRLVERVGNRRLNQVIRESRRFRSAYWSCCGDAVIYGSPYLFKWNPRDWCPAYAGRPLMPRNAPADVYDPAFSRWAFAGELSGADIMAMLKEARRSKKGHWNVSGLEATLKQLAQELNPDKDHEWDHEFDEEDPEKWEEMIQTNAIWNDILGSSAKVYYFFQKQLNGEVDCYIVSRLREKVQAHQADGTVRMDIQRKGKEQSELFYQASRFKSVKECLWPMILDVKFGGKAMAHRVLGLGRLNYDMDRAVSQLINTGMAGLEDDFRPIYQTDDFGSLKKIEQWVNEGAVRGSVLPGDIRAFERQSNARNYGNLMAFLNTMDVAQGSNAAAHAASSGGPRGSKELEVQALERQQENAQNINARMEDWAEMGQPLAQQMVEALTGRGKMVNGDRGFPERERLKELLAEDGVLLEELDPALLTVRFRRHLGAGDASIRLQRAEKKMSVINMYDPDKQRIILREWTEAVDESYERANELVPEAQQVDQNQVNAAAAQTALCLSSGTPAQPNPTDIPEIHAGEHIKSAQGVIAANAQTGLDPSLVNGMAALLEHAAFDAQMIAAKGNAELAAQFIRQIQQISQQAQEIALPAPTSKEQAELELKQRNQALQEQKRNDAVAKFDRQQGHRESVDGQKMSLDLQELAMDERELALKEEEAIVNQQQGNQQSENV